jgi:hypothetical protein
MTATVAAHNTQCKEAAHDEHLCYLQFDGYHYSNRAEYKALVQDAQFICRNCNRTAQRGENLCAPDGL